jgi:hypothetical protein
MTENFHRQKEETWNVVDREGQENADWKKTTTWNPLQAQVLLERSNGI